MKFTPRKFFQIHGFKAIGEMTAKLTLFFDSKVFQYLRFLHKPPNNYYFLMLYEGTGLHFPFPTMTLIAAKCQENELRPVIFLIKIMSSSLPNKGSIKVLSKNE